jgi:hypothetical protein
MTILCHVLACESQMLQSYRDEKYLEIRWGLCLVTFRLTKNVTVLIVNIILFSIRYVEVIRLHESFSFVILHTRGWVWIKIGDANVF